MCGNDLGVDDITFAQFTERTITLYTTARAVWSRRGLLKSQSNISAEEKAEANWKEPSSAIGWWGSAGVRSPSDDEGKRALKELVEFDQRTLAVSPTATATERSFSHEKRIHSLQRANLAPERVRKLLFCQWNSRVLQDGADKDEDMMTREAEKKREPIQKLRSVRATVSESVEASRSAAAFSVTRSDTNSIRIADSNRAEASNAGTRSDSTSRDDDGNTVHVPPLVPQFPNRSKRIPMLLPSTARDRDATRRNMEAINIYSGEGNDETNENTRVQDESPNRNTGEETTSMEVNRNRGSNREL